LLEERVKLIDAGSDAQINCLFTKINNNSSEDRRVDLVRDLDRLGLESSLGLLERSLEASKRVSWERRSRGDDDLQLAPVFAYKRINSFDHTVSFSKSAVLAHNREQVLSDIRNLLLLRTSSGREDGVNPGGTILGGEGGVFDKGSKIGGGFYGRADGREFTCVL